MHVSIDGPIGSGKTTLTELLADMHNGVAALFAPITPADRGTDDLRKRMIEDLSSVHDMLEMLYATDQYRADTRPRSFFLSNLLRVIFVTAQKAFKDKPIFIDAFWEPLWTFQPEHLSRFYRFHNNFISAPDVSIFLKIPGHRTISRAQGRDIDVEHTADATSIDTHQRNFIEWADMHIPNFRVIDATHSISDVLKFATDIISEPDTQPKQTQSESLPVEVPVREGKIVSLRNRILEKRG